MAKEIPVIEVQGTHREVGQQIGEQMRSVWQALVARWPDTLPAGVCWANIVKQSELYLAHSRQAYPRYIDELEGMAEGSGLPLSDLFAGMCEELWDPQVWKRGCSDMAARGRATADGSTLLAHTNDLSPSAEENLVILKVQAGDEPEFLAVSPGGLGASAGYNAAGISLTGNEVSCNDIRPGVPRQLIVRAILAARRLEEAMNACLLPTRASNYNNIIADAHGEVYSMEGSATDCEPIYIDGDILAHANHFVTPAMRPFEADRNDIGGSVIRHNRALRLLREHFGHLTPELFQTLLADHANYPGSLCKHGLESVTVFSIIISLEQRRSWIGRGRPCQTTWHEYQLAPWQPPEDWPR